jgi:hypothetical protein
MSDPLTIIVASLVGVGVTAITVLLGSSLYLLSVVAWAGLRSWWRRRVV